MKEEHKIDRLYKKLAKAEEKNLSSKESIWDKIEMELEPEKKSTYKLPMPIIAIAASFLVIISAVWFFTNSENSTKNTPISISKNEESKEEQMNEPNAATSMVQADSYENADVISDEETYEKEQLEKERNSISEKETYAYQDVRNKNEDLEKRISAVETILMKQKKQDASAQNPLVVEDEIREDQKELGYNQAVAGVKIESNASARVMAPVPPATKSEISNANKMMDSDAQNAEITLYESVKSNSRGKEKDLKNYKVSKDSIAVEWKEVNVKKLNSQELINYKNTLQKIDTLKLSKEDLKIYRSKWKQINRK